ncbi:bifunctional DNA primase/polymerase, partial [bacterium]|nr:bifunctional DNA primase/polymerase [bacterium]
VPGRKAPVLKEWPVVASSDPDTIRDWFEETHRGCDVGIVTGVESGCFVLDVDPANGGEESLDALVAVNGRLPDTVVCQTGGGGAHYYFQMPSGVAVRNAVEIDGRGGLDIRGEGGFVVAPPSVHASGAAYEWELSSVLGEVAIAAAPDWLIALVAGSPGNGKGNGTSVVQGHVSSAPIRIPMGSRNSTLTSLAGRLRRDGYESDEIGALLRRVRERRCDGLDDPKEPFPAEEVDRIARGMDRYPSANSIEPVDPEGWLTNASAKSLEAIMAEEKPARPPSIIGDGLLPERSLAAFFGASNLGKTWVTLAMALSVAGGRDLFGWNTNANNVLYICPELDLVEFWDRVIAIERADCSIRCWNPNAPAVRKDLEAARSRIFPITGDMLPHLPDLRKPEDRQAIIAAVRARSAKLLLLDPFALLHSASENSNDEMLEVLRGLHEIRVQADVTPVVVHHPRKGKPGQDDGGFDAMRGAGAIAAHARVILRLAEKRGVLCLSCEKATHTRRPEPLWLERLSSGALKCGTPPVDVRAERDRRAEAVVTFLKSHVGRWMSLEEIRTGVPEVQVLKDRTIRDYLKDNVSSAESAGALEVSGTTRDRR